MTKQHFRRLVQNPSALKTDFEYWVQSFCFKHGYRVGVDSARVGIAHQKWITNLSVWSSSTVVAATLGGLISDERLDQYLADVRSKFAGTSLNNSHIKMVGSLLHELCTSQPIRYVVPYDDDYYDVVSDLMGLSTESSRPSVPNVLLEAAPDEYLAFRYSLDRFALVQNSRLDKPRCKEPVELPITKHYEQNLVAQLQHKLINANALYMLFKTLDLYCMDHNGELV